MPTPSQLSCSFKKTQQSNEWLRLNEGEGSPPAFSIDVGHIHYQHSIQLRIHSQGGAIRQRGVDNLTEADIGFACLYGASVCRGVCTLSRPPPLVYALPTCICDVVLRDYTGEDQESTAAISMKFFGTSKSCGTSKISDSQRRAFLWQLLHLDLLLPAFLSRDDCS